MYVCADVKINLGWSDRFFGFERETDGARSSVTAIDDFNAQVLGVRIYEFDRHALERRIGNELYDLLQPGRRTDLLPVGEDIVDVCVPAPKNGRGGGKANIGHGAAHRAMNSVVPGEQCFAQVARAVERL